MPSLATPPTFRAQFSSSPFHPTFQPTAAPPLQREKRALKKKRVAAKRRVLRDDPKKGGRQDGAKTTPGPRGWVQTCSRPSRCTNWPRSSESCCAESQLAEQAFDSYRKRKLKGEEEHRQYGSVNFNGEAHKKHGLWSMFLLPRKPN